MSDVHFDSVLRFLFMILGFSFVLTFLSCFKSHYFLLSSWPGMFKKSLVLLLDILGENS
jgi:hypothetical protein